MPEQPALTVHSKENTMKNYKGLLFMMIVAVSVWACAGTAPKEELNVQRTNVLSMTATVEKIDLQKRRVTLRNAEGTVRTLQVSKKAVNLPQVRVGDKVMLDYIESLAVRMAQPGEVRDEVKGVIGRAKPGDKPGYVEEIETTVTATILDLDKVKETATLKGPDGDIVVVKVQDPSNFDKVKIGDTIVITYTEALAIAVRSVQ
jgi:Cu/Ag efflux protein CusF